MGVLDVLNVVEVVDALEVMLDVVDVEYLGSENFGNDLLILFAYAQHQVYLLLCQGHRLPSPSVDLLETELLGHPVGVNRETHVTEVTEM